MDPRDFFSDRDRESIVSAIRQAELRTSGEIRVHVRNRSGEDTVAAAREAFDNLGMSNTELRNGVLFLIAVQDRSFAIFGDDGIDEKVPEGFWEATRDCMQARFREGDFTNGLIEAITMAGEQLAQFFPARRDDINELPDAISFEENEC
jgi:uncharacterized membrane protein